MRRTIRSGLTLIEVLIALAILAIAASIIYPNVFRQPSPVSAASETHLIEQAKSLALARAEPVDLRVGSDGAWEIVALSGPAPVLASGQLPESPPSAFDVRVTELGACLPGPLSKLRAPHEGTAIDAVSCTLRP